MKYVILTIPTPLFLSAHTDKHAQTHFVSTISIHIGMPLLCPAVPAIFPPLRKTAAFYASWKP